MGIIYGKSIKFDIECSQDHLEYRRIARNIAELGNTLLLNVNRELYMLSTDVPIDLTLNDLEI